MLGCAPNGTDHPYDPPFLPEKYHRWPRVSIAILAQSAIERSRHIIKRRGTGLDPDAKGLDPVADDALRKASQLFPVDREPCKKDDEPYTIKERLTESLGNSCRVLITLFRSYRYSLGRGSDTRLTAYANRII